MVDPGQICCTDPVAARKELFQSFGATAFDTTLEVSTRNEPRTRNWMRARERHVCLGVRGTAPCWNDTLVVMLAIA